VAAPDADFKDHVTRLSELMDRCTLGAGTARVDVGEDWMQGRSVFGGLQAAVALRAMRTLVADVPLRALQMTFIAPVAGDLRARARILRSGKSATHVEARIGADDQVLATALGIFGGGRASIVRRDLPAPVPMTAKGKFPFVAGIVPDFMQHFDVDLLEGALPFSATQVERVVYQLALRDSGPMSEAHLLAIADFVPPVALSWMPAVVPGASMTWMLEILDEDFASQPLHGWRIDARMVAAREGYTSQSTTIHAPNGSAIALSRQSMAVFA